MNWRERAYCGSLTPKHEGQRVRLMGWVDAVRDHGSLLFVHLRDVRGIVQVVFDPRVSRETYAQAAALREEYAVEVSGEVRRRAAGTENPHLDTGDIEVIASGLTVYSRSRTLPFQISEKAIVFGGEIQANPEHVDEELRLRYRYLDLRRPSVQALFLKRHQIVRCVRAYLEESGFCEVETPFLTKSTPEGARDYLVPSRVHPGRFYALPQSPQLFKQLLMMGGLDRYYQIVRCFRDEDLRPNRQPEFTQLDLEASFVDAEFIYEHLEELTARMFALGGIALPRPFPRMTYDTAMNRYGSDRPDLRFDLAFEDVTDILKDTRYAVFRNIIQRQGHIKGFCVRGQGSRLSKNLLQNEYAMRIVPSFGGQGMTWMKVAEGRLQSNIAQFFEPAELDGLRDRFDAREGDVLMLVADASLELVNRVLCSLRLHVADRLNLADNTVYSPLWVTDFPLFERKEEGIGSQHHPFTMPDRTDFDPADLEGLLNLKSRAYDLVMNGEELGGGSIRIHDMAVQERVFRALGMSPSEVEAKFGFFLKALEYGAPPHAGLALGIDRVVAMILKAGSIRDVIAFPKNRSALCPLTLAPSEVEPAQLEELGLKRIEPEKRAAGVPGAGRDEKARAAAGEPAEKISLNEVRHVAKLARLSLEKEEIKEFQKDLNSILEYMDTLRELDTAEIEPMSHVLDMRNIWREDEPPDTSESEPILNNAPARQEDYFKVPKILEG